MCIKSQEGLTPNYEGNMKKYEEDMKEKWRKNEENTQENLKKYEEKNHLIRLYSPLYEAVISYGLIH